MDRAQLEQRSAELQHHLQVRQRPRKYQGAPWGDQVGAFSKCSRSFFPLASSARPVTQKPSCHWSWVLSTLFDFWPQHGMQISGCQNSSMPSEVPGETLGVRRGSTLAPWNNPRPHLACCPLSHGKIFQLQQAKTSCCKCGER